MFPFFHQCRNKQKQAMNISMLTALATPVTPTAVQYQTPKGGQLMTIHLDGRITVSETLQPTETAKQVLDMMKQYWMSDIQATKIRELQDRIEELEDLWYRSSERKEVKP